MKRVIFLNYDGVVNREMWEFADDQWICRKAPHTDGKVNDVQAVQWVSAFCENFGYDIVVTSDWRQYPDWEKCLRAAGLRNSVNVIDALPLPLGNKAKEISDYLAQHADIDFYLVFDADESLLKRIPDDQLEAESESEYDLLFDNFGEHHDHLVLCQQESGFGKKEYETAVSMHFGQKYKMEAAAAGKNNSGDLINEAVELLYTQGELSTSLLQRTFRIGYARAAYIVDLLKENGIVAISRQRGVIRYKPLVEYVEAKEKIKNK